LAHVGSNATGKADAGDEWRERAAVGPTGALDRGTGRASNTMIEAHALTRRFGGVLAVADLSLQVGAGTVLALLGPNGAGKTTTVRMLAGLLAPTSGTATIAGVDVRADPAGVRARVGLMTDTPGLYEQMTAPAYLTFFGRLYGLDLTHTRRRIDELLALFDLADRCGDRMTGFSKGMKQKVALARALLHEPAVVFLDEPTSGLDPLAARAVRDQIVDLKHASRTVVLCTHDLDEAERLADAIVIVRQGRIVAAGSPAALRASASAASLVRVTLATPCPVASTVLALIDGVTEPTASTAEGDQVTVLTYRTTAPATVNPEVVAQLVTVGARIVGVATETRTLEDVYATAVGVVPSPGAPFLAGALPGAVEA
jgi:ABC-2 type transport system ATP-binding protein